MKNNDIVHISYLEIEKGFDLASHIKSINANPNEIRITANKIPSETANNIFRIDYNYVDLKDFIAKFLKTKININIEIGNDYLRDYLFEIY